MLSDQAKNLLLDLARRSVRDFLEETGEEGGTGNGPFPEDLQEKKGILVALYSQGRLRGCIGSLLGVLPLWQACRENARSAAVKDSRFPPVGREELSDLDFEITILETPRPLEDPSRIKAGKDGLVLKKGFRREVFLPGAVAGLIGEGKDLFQELKRRAGFEADDDAEEEWQAFEAEVINPQSAD